MARSHYKRIALTENLMLQSESRLKHKKKNRFYKKKRYKQTREQESSPSELIVGVRVSVEGVHDPREIDNEAHDCELDLA